jgi:hypothetical protein
MDTDSHREISSAGGKARWNGVGKRKRKAIMKEVVRKRWEKAKKNGKGSLGEGAALPVKPSASLRRRAKFQGRK